VRDHIVKKHKMKMSDYKTRYQAFSQEHVCTQELSELARVRCRVCGLVLLHHRIRAHLLSVHGSGRKGGYEFVKQTFYRNGNHRFIQSYFALKGLYHEMDLVLNDIYHSLF
jgi:hypothetical protein